MMDNSRKVNVLIGGTNHNAAIILTALLGMNNYVNIIGIVGSNSCDIAAQMANKHNIPVFYDYIQLVQNTRIDVVIDTSENNEISEELKRLSNKDISIIDSMSVILFKQMSVVQNNLNQDLMKAKEMKEQLYAILNSAQEGIEVADSEGIILYINKAVTDITKLLPSQRIGKNIYEVSPNGALSEVLRTKKPVFGKVNMTQDTFVDVISNGSPIIVDGKMIGGVTVFRDVTDIKRMANTIQENRDFIDTLKEGINQLAVAKYSFNDINGNSQEINNCIKLAKKAAYNNSTVLITGESGTGKELFAHSIHNFGPRRSKAFIKVNCAAIPEQLLESELFGHVKGAFTGALKAKMGKFELAHSGTIFLDEIGDMTLTLQAKILRVLQEKEIERLGGEKTTSIDVQIIAATNKDLLAGVEIGTFRRDLFYRLNVIPINLPPLRQRKDDILFLVNSILEKKNKRYSKNCYLDSIVIQNLLNYEWPGNVRELDNVLERAVIMAESTCIGPENINLFPITLHKEVKKEEIIPLYELEKDLILKALKFYGSDTKGKKMVAQKLSISLGTLYSKLEKYNISEMYKKNFKITN